MIEEHVYTPRAVRTVAAWLGGRHGKGVSPGLRLAVETVVRSIEGDGVGSPEMTPLRDAAGVVEAVKLAWHVGPRSLRLVVSGWAVRRGRAYPVLAWAMSQRIGSRDVPADEGESDGPGWVDPVRRSVDWVHGGAAVASLGGLAGVDQRAW